MGARRAVPGPHRDRPRGALTVPRPGAARRGIPGRRAAWTAIAVVATATVFVGILWHRYVSSGWLAADVRRVVVRQLEQSLARAADLGRVSGSLTRGVSVRDLRIAERGGFAHGVAFSAEEVRLSFNWRSFLTVRPGAASGFIKIDLLRPRLVLSRTAAGTWSFGDVLVSRGTPATGRFRGRVVVHDGSLLFSDAYNVPEPLVAAFDQVTGDAEFLASEVTLTLGGWSRDAERIQLSGRYRPNGGTSTFDITAANAAAARWGPYFVRLPELGWERGRFAGQVHVSLTPSESGFAFDYKATVRVYGTDVEYRPAHVWVRDVSGPITVDSVHAETSGLLLHANGSPLSADGTLVFAGGPWVQLHLRTPALDLATVQALFFPEAALTITGEAGAELQVTGPVQALDVEGEITAARGALNGQAFEGLHTRMQYAGGTLALTSLRSSVAGGRLSGNLVLDVASGTPSYLFSGTTSDVDIRAFASAGVSGVDAVRGRMSGRMVGVGAGPRMQLLGDVTLGPGSVQGVPFDSLHAIFWHDEAGAVDVDYLSGQIGGATIYSSGRIGPDGALDLAVLAHDLSFADFGARAGPRTAPFDGRVDLLGRATGTLAAPVFSGSIAATHGRVGPIAFARAHGSFTANPTALTSLRLALFNGSARYQVNGGITFDPLAASQLTLDAEDVDAQWLTGALDWAPDVTGLVSGTLVVDGPLPRASVAGRVVLQHGSIGGQRVDHAEIHLTPESGRLRIADAEARIGGSRVFTTGTIDPAGALDLRWGAEDVQLADLSAVLGVDVPAQGTLALSGEVHGTVRTPRVSGEISAPDIEVHGQRFAASGTVAYEGGVLQLTGLQLAQGASRYRLSGTIRRGPRPSASLALDVEGGRVATALGAAGITPPAPLDGTLDGRIELSGPLDDPSAHLSLTLQDARFGAYAIGNGVADLTLTHQRIDIDRFEIHPAQGQVAAKGRVDLLGPSSVEVSAQDLNPDFLRPFFQLDRALQGRLNFTLQVSGPTRDPKAGVSLEAFDAGVEGVQVDRISALAFYSAGVLHIEQGLISKGPHKLVAIGTLPVDPSTFMLDARAPLQLQLRLQDADLSFLGLITPEITDASGTVAGEVNVAGTIAVPQMAGFLRSSGGRLRYAPLRTPIEDLHIDLSFSQDQIQVQDLSAAIGQGRVEANGVVGITNFRPDSVQLALRAEHATLDVPGVYSGQVDAEIALTGQARQPTVSGRMALSNGRLSPGGSASAGAAPDVGFNGTLEVGPNTVFTRGPVRAQVEGAVHVGGTLARPLASGDITSSGGEFAFLGSSFRLTGGEAVFSESRGVEPQISAHAERFVGDTIVMLDICGLASELRVCHISSIPPLPEGDIYSLVAADAGIMGGPESAVGQGLGRSLLGSICEPLHLSECAIAYSRESPVTFRIGGFLLQNVYLRLSEVWTGPTTPATSLTLGTFPRQIPIGQSYAVAGLEYYLSPSVLATLNLDTLGGSGLFLLTRFPF